MNLTEPWQEELIEITGSTENNPWEALEDIFRPSFMRKYTQFSHIRFFIESSPLSLDDLDELDEGVLQELNDFIRKKSYFPDWKTMWYEAQVDPEIHRFEREG